MSTEAHLAQGPRRLLMTTDAVGGVWDYSLELCAALAQAQVEVVLAVLGPGPTQSQYEAASVHPNIELVAKPGRLEWMEDPWTDVDAAGRWLLGLSDTRMVDMVHLNDYAHGVLPFAVPRLVVGHSCVLSWWKAVKGEGAPATWDIYRQRVRAGLHAAQAVVAPSRSMAAALLSLYRPRCGVRVIHNGRTPGSWQPGAAKQPFILSAGRLWDEAKNVGRLVRVARELPWPVKVAGALARGKDDIPQTPSPPPSATNVHWLGKLSTAAMAEQFGQAAIYALPARYEPFGLSVLEAALAGCALVLGDIPSLRELWAGAASFVAPDDEQGLCRVLRGLIANPARRQEQGRMARRRALRFSPGAMVDAYLAVYRGLGAQEQPGACAS